MDKPFATPTTPAGSRPAPVHRLKPLSALGRTGIASDTIGPVAIAETLDIAVASLAARRDHDVELIAAEAGIPLPGSEETAEQGDWSTFWVGPRKWFVEASYATHEDIAAHLKDIFGDAVSVTEQTGAWARFEVTGTLQPLFERLCNLDLERFNPGSARSTVIEHLGVYAIRRAADRITLLGPRSSAATLHHALLVAARSAF